MKFKLEESTDYCYNESWEDEDDESLRDDSWEDTYWQDNVLSPVLRELEKRYGNKFDFDTTPFGFIVYRYYKTRYKEFPVSAHLYIRKDDLINLSKRELKDLIMSRMEDRKREIRSLRYLGLKENTMKFKLEESRSILREASQNQVYLAIDHFEPGTLNVIKGPDAKVVAQGYDAYEDVTDLKGIVMVGFNDENVYAYSTGYNSYWNMVKAIQKGEFQFDEFESEELTNPLNSLDAIRSSEVDRDSGYCFILFNSYSGWKVAREGWMKGSCHINWIRADNQGVDKKEKYLINLLTKEFDPYDEAMFKHDLEKGFFKPSDVERRDVDKMAFKVIESYMEELSGLGGTYPTFSSSMNYLRDELGQDYLKQLYNKKGPFYKYIEYIKKMMLQYLENK